MPNGRVIETWPFAFKKLPIMFLNRHRGYAGNLFEPQRHTLNAVDIPAPGVRKGLCHRAHICLARAGIKKGSCCARLSRHLAPTIPFAFANRCSSRCLMGIIARSVKLVSMCIMCNLRLTDCVLPNLIHLKLISIQNELKFVTLFNDV